MTAAEVYTSPAVIITVSVAEAATPAAPKVGIPDMPEDVLCGRLGELSENNLTTMGFPRAYAWLASLAVASVLVPNPEARDDVDMEMDAMMGIAPAPKKVRRNVRLSDPKLFVAMVGHTFSGKTKSVDYALEMLGAEPGATPESPIFTGAYGSAELLTKAVGDRKGAPRLWYREELGHTLKKANIKDASFPDVLCELYHTNLFEFGIKDKDKYLFNARLSIVGGIVDDKFSGAFTGATTGGMHDRFLFGLQPTGHEFNFRPYDGEVLGNLSLQPVGINGSVWEASNEYGKKHPGCNKRVIESCLRVAGICAAFDGLDTLTGEYLAPAFALAEYQERIRKVLKPSEGETYISKCWEKIKNYLEANAPDGQWVRERDIKQETHLARLGMDNANRAFDLMRGDYLIERTVMTEGKNKVKYWRLVKFEE